jgi:Cu-Zn family superoxide dismutase
MSKTFFKNMVVITIVIVLLYLVFCLLFFIKDYYMEKKPIQAIAFFNDKKIKGIVMFTEDLKKNDVIIDIHIIGLKKNGKHGFHVHESGDLSENCKSMCAHFNPYGKTHGCPGMKERHVGDLGNLHTDAQGVAHYRMRDNVIKLRGNKANIIGRGLIIHADEDDCGQGGFDDSLKTGHAGERIACAVIGYSKNNFGC